ncbi:MAG TPA: SDR family oxidoreductase [Bryobacteraceae bacterium]
MINDANATFLTGATRLVGGLVLRKMAEQRPDHTIFALTRRTAGMPQLPKVRWLKGDISQQRLGLPKSIYMQLCESVGTIIHCAASTKFTLPLAASRNVNLRGTANVLELARQTKRLQTLLHISTTYVAGRRSGALHEAELANPEGWFSAYEQSKFEAEKLIFETGGDLPWIIARPSTIVGNSLTGKVSQSNYFHQLLRLVPSSPLPVIPGSPEVLVDIVADNWITDGLLAILNGKPTTHSIFHLCTGPPQSFPAGEIVEMAFCLYGRQRSSPAAKVPRFVTLEEFQTFADVLRRNGQTARSRIADPLLLYLPHLSVQQPFLNGNTNGFLQRVGERLPPSPREFLPRIIRSC